MDCNFCGVMIPAGTEYIYVTNKGRAHYFCSSKCLKNLVKLERKPRETLWTKAYRVEKEARVKSQGKSEEKPEVKTAVEKPESASAHGGVKVSGKTAKEGESTKAAKPVKRRK